MTTTQNTSLWGPRYGDVYPGAWLISPDARQCLGCEKFVSPGLMATHEDECPAEVGLYVVRRAEGETVNYDEYRAAVVRARSERHAREIVADLARTFDRYDYDLDQTVSDQDVPADRWVATPLTLDGPTGAVVTDYVAG